ncbi:sigma-54-dependent transcriptional regulator [Desulfatirhabdium butyrativorans]|uniref:sigma-54-dependent transcriptional regulator n=1 Tax=Desulfatirhabdium butyrativorans TaxID=340467 RepID=UPI000413A8C3|nr:sigma-54 dependent transcriptional regulator [Desulfatirhabdium butyrativorans]
MPPKIPRILIVDDEPHICRNCEKILSKLPCETESVLNGYDALERMASAPFDVVVTDLKMSALGGMELLRRIREDYPLTRVIVMTGYASVSSAVEVMKIGACDYLPKPFTPHELRSVVRQAIEKEALSDRRLAPMSEAKASQAAKTHQLIGNSPQIRQVVAMIQKVAPTDATVFIWGESGTGKELVARAVHANSRRADKVFFAVDCGTLSGNLLASELFGHAKGAFTGADREKEGIFKLADGGTVFLDEISNISLEVQGMLLRFLESREFLPVGGTSVQHVHVRLIFATNQNLQAMVDSGTFRQDFYYRIFVYPIVIPALRERKSDILPIATHFLKLFSRNLNKTILGFDPAAEDYLVGSEWPGNVRQLRNSIERAVIQCESERIRVQDMVVQEALSSGMADGTFVPGTNEALKEAKKSVRQSAVWELEKRFLIHALTRNDWNVTRAARETGIQRTNFQGMMKKYGITRPSRSGTH